LTGTNLADVLKKVTSVVDVTCRGRSYPLLRYRPARLDLHESGIIG
jgi:hypothetical protein